MESNGGEWNWGWSNGCFPSRNLFSLFWFLIWFLITTCQGHIKWKRCTCLREHKISIRKTLFLMYYWLVKVKSLSRTRLFATPWTVACTKLLCPWDFLSKSTGVGCRFLLQGIFLTQGSNPGLPHCRQTLYHLSHQGSPLLVKPSARKSDCLNLNPGLITTTY